MALNTVDRVKFEALNTFEISRRVQKAYALAEVLLDAGCDSAEASTFTDDDWQQWSIDAGVHKPSDATRQLVVQALKRSEGVTCD